MEQVTMFFGASESALPFMAPVTLNDKVEHALEAIKAQVRAGRHITVAWSGGKDSSVTLSLALQAMKDLVANGYDVPTLHVIHSNTLIENPVVAAYNEEIIDRINTYAKTASIPVRVWVGSPGLSNDYLVSLIGGRIIMSTGANTKCQQMMKAAPLTQLHSKVKKHISISTGVPVRKVEIVNLVGTRFDESATRGRAMQDRGESADDAVDVMGDGKLVLSPIAHFSQMDVFEFIGNVRSGRLETYDDFDRLVELYRDMNGGDCMVTAYLADQQQAKAPCDARTGCWGCGRVSRDASAESLIATEGGKYAWMKPLHDLRAYMLKMHNNPTARTWLARNVGADGWIEVAPNAYSPGYTQELLGIVLSIQADEILAARKLGIKPRFKLLTLKQIMAIELSWGRYGYQPAWTALRLYRDVYRSGKRVRIPDTSSLPDFTSADVSFRSRVPFADGQFSGVFSGLRDVDAAAADCESLTVTRTGRYVTEVQVGNEYDIDDEGLALFMEFEFDRVIDSARLNGTPNAAIHYLLGLGTVQLYKGSHADWDRMLRVSNQITRHELQPILHDPQAIVDKLSGGIKLQEEGLFNSGNQGEG